MNENESQDLHEDLCAVIESYLKIAHPSDICQEIIKLITIEICSISPSIGESLQSLSEGFQRGIAHIIKNEIHEQKNIKNDAE